MPYIVMAVSLVLLGFYYDLHIFLKLILMLKMQ